MAGHARGMGGRQTVGLCGPRASRAVQRRAACDAGLVLGCESQCGPRWVAAVCKCAGARTSCSVRAAARVRLVTNMIGTTQQRSMPCCCGHAGSPAQKARRDVVRSQAVWRRGFDVRCVCDGTPHEELARAQPCFARAQQGAEEQKH